MAMASKLVISRNRLPGSQPRHHWLWAEAVVSVVSHSVEFEMGTMPADNTKLCNGNVEMLTASLWLPRIPRQSSPQRFYPRRLEHF